MKTKNKKENVPSVTWISMEPETSSRTTLKSFADYLSETHEDVPMPKRRLCLSPVTLNIIHDAEKLVEDAEKQISQLEANTLTEDGFDDIQFDDRRIDDDRLYIRNVVTTMFQKGYYEPGSRTVAIKMNTPADSIVTESVKRKQYSSRKTSRSIQKRLEVNQICDECFVCKSSRVEQAEKINSDVKVIESCNIEEVKMTGDKPEKLNVQKGPSINIKGDFSVQTKSIIDIQPDKSNERKTKENNFDNIATYEYHHASCSKSNVSIIDEKSIQHTSENKCRRMHVNKSPSKKVDSKNYFWEPIEEIIDFDLDDFSLREPGILTEVDSLLDHQKIIIKKIQDATEKFDKFLSKKSFDESSSKEIKSKKNQRTRNDLKNSINLSTSIESLKNSEEIIHSNGVDSIIKDSQSVDSLSNKEIQSSSKIRSSKISEKEASKDVERNSNSKISITIEKSETNRKKIDNEISSNNSSIVNTETKSNAGFIENLKSLQTLKESNLIANTRRNDKMLEEIRISSNAKSSGKFSGNQAEGNYDDEKSLKVSVTEDEEELQNYIFEHFSERETIKHKEKKDEKSGENSQKTSHLIESISDENILESYSQSSSDDSKDEIGSGKKQNTIENLNDELANVIETSVSSRKGIEVNNDFIDNEPSKDKPEIPVENQNEIQSEMIGNSSSKNESTESKIENILSEARTNFNNLMRTTIDENKTRSNLELNEQDTSKENSIEVSELSLEKKADNVQKKVNTVTELDIFKMPIAQNSKTIHRSIVSMLEDNEKAVSDTTTQHKLSLITKLESCSIPNSQQKKRLFTSTVLGDTEPPNCFTKSKASSTIRSEASSDTQSEGEVCFSSSGSYSVGEVRKKPESSSTTNGTLKSQTNELSSLTPSAGEL